jgi:hypothetical protein
MQTQTLGVRPHAPRELEANVQGERYSAFRDSIGGVILARIGDGASTYFVRGAEARAFWDGVYMAEDGGASFDGYAAEYDGLMQPAEAMHGRPDDSGMFWVWQAPDRRA